MDPAAILSFSQITTIWATVIGAHCGPADEMQRARQLLVDRYGGAIHRYLLRVLGDPQTAHDVAQDFCLSILHGKLHGADQARGRFRAYLKGALHHQVQHHRRRNRPLVPLTPASEPTDPETGPGDLEEDFACSWREELLAGCWARLAQLEQPGGPPYYTLLRYRMNHPALRSAEIAEHLSREFGRDLTAAGVRQMLHRAREKFGLLLLEGVVHSLDQPTRQQVEEELLELGLLKYCGWALDAWQWSS
jgi:RNA polymerase sigma-70 factor (ECF subfamily)